MVPYFIAPYSLCSKMLLQVAARQLKRMEFVDGQIHTPVKKINK